MPINFVNVPPEAVYWHRLIALTDSIVQGCDAIFEATNEAEVGHPYFRADPATHARIDAVLLAAANVRKLIFPARSRKSDGAAIRKLRTRRAERMQEALAGLTFDQIRNTAVRNSLEHFDERLDFHVAAHRFEAQNDFRLAAYNLVVSRTDVATPPLLALRLYIASERRYECFSDSADLACLRREAEAISVRVRELNVLGVDDRGGALILPFPYVPSGERGSE